MLNIVSAKADERRGIEEQEAGEMQREREGSQVQFSPFGNVHIGSMK